MLYFTKFFGADLKICCFALGLIGGFSLLTSACHAEDLDMAAHAWNASRSNLSNPLSTNPGDSQKKHEVDLTSPYASFRLGFVVSPTLSIQGGLDVTFPRFSLAKDWTTRVDVEFQALLNSPSFGSRRDSVFSLNVCQVYSRGEFSRSKFYLGGGLGTFFGPFKGTIGGKLFVGSHLSQTVSFELQALFPGETTPQIGVDVRISVF